MKRYNNYGSVHSLIEIKFVLGILNSYLNTESPKFLSCTYRYYFYSGFVNVLNFLLWETLNHILTNTGDLIEHRCSLTDNGLSVSSVVFSLAHDVSTAYLV